MQNSYRATVLAAISLYPRLVGSLWTMRHLKTCTLSSKTLRSQLCHPTSLMCTSSELRVGIFSISSHPTTTSLRWRWRTTTRLTWSRTWSTLQLKQFRFRSVSQRPFGWVTSWTTKVTVFLSIARAECLTPRSTRLGPRSLRIPQMEILRFTEIHLKTTATRETMFSHVSFRTNIKMATRLSNLSTCLWTLNLT